MIEKCNYNKGEHCKKHGYTHRPILKILDLECGLKGWSRAFADRGHEVTTVDIEESFKPDICADIMTLTAGSFGKSSGYYDIILASPPCNKFSVAALYHNWDKDTGKPKNQATINAIHLVAQTVKIIIDLQPRWWILENPRGMMRRILGFPSATVTYCQYGEKIMKPTDLWGVLPKHFKPKSCNNRDKCHQAAPRSSVYGTQGIGINKEAFKKNKFAYMVRGGGGNSALRAMIPYGLSKDICLAIEKELGGF